MLRKNKPPADKHPVEFELYGKATIEIHKDLHKNEKV